MEAEPVPTTLKADDTDAAAGSNEIWFPGKQTLDGGLPTEKLLGMGQRTKVFQFAAPTLELEASSKVQGN